MRIVRTVADVRAAVADSARPVGLVPTMGALHDGHLSLIRAAREQCATVVVSLFVNPTQFNEQRDLAQYPRDEQRDAELASGAGADLLFAPDAAEVYPPGFATTVTVAGITATLEGAERGPGHFDGVATVVTKLLNMVGPDHAYFGQKDAQQAAVIRRFVTDLNIPVTVHTVPTVREPDGLALSSRNVHLHGDDRDRARALHAALTAAERATADGEREARAIRAGALAAMQPFGVEPEYLELVDPETLDPVTMVQDTVLVAVAARVGSTRLIDNTLIHPNGRR